MSLFPLASLPLILLCHGGGYGDPGYPNIFNPPIYFCLQRMRTRSALSLNRRPPSHTGSVTMRSRCCWLLQAHCHWRIDCHNVLTSVYHIVRGGALSWWAPSRPADLPHTSYTVVL